MFSKNNLIRSLLVFDTIFKEVEKRGCKITIGQSRYKNVPFVVQDDLKIPIILFETKTPYYPKYIKIQGEEPKYTGLLTCTLYYQIRKITKEFLEDDKHKMEDYLAAIVNDIILGFEIKRQFKAYVLNNKNLREQFDLSIVP